MEEGCRVAGIPRLKAQTPGHFGYTLLRDQPLFLHLSFPVHTEFRAYLEELWEA